MRNRTPGFTGWNGSRGGVLCWALLAMMVAAWARPAAAANRRFMVILANPPKTFADTGGEPPQGFANPALVHGQYFDDNPNNGVYSMAEWWSEISYRAVTVSGETFGWINLPWPLEPPADPGGEPGDSLSPAAFINLDIDDGYVYGHGEPFSEDPMPYQCFDQWCDGIAVDYNGDNETEAPRLGRPLDAYPPGVLTDPDFIEECRCCTGDGDCEWFTIDANQDGVPESCDLPPDGDEQPNPSCPVNSCCSPYGCIELCIGDAPGEDPNCLTGQITPPLCYAVGGIPIMDASTECVIPCSLCPPTHLGTLGVQVGGPNIPSLPLHDGIYTPGERFRDVNRNGRYDALHEPPFDEDEDGDCEYGEVGSGNDYLDVDLEGFDEPEPFEDFLVRWSCTAFGGLGNWVPVSRDYVYSNYPLNPDWDFEEELALLMERFGYGPCDARSLVYWTEDPCVYLTIQMYLSRGLGDFVAGNPLFPFEVNENAVAAWTNVDEMAWRIGNGVYDPPERFRDARDPDEDADDDARVTTKMQQVDEATTTPRPGSGGGLDTVDWYEDFWRSRYGTDPPLWVTGST